MRLIFSRKDLDRMFAELQQKSLLNFSGLAKKYSLSSRTIRNWSKDKNTIPAWFINNIKRDFQIEIPTPIQTLNESFIKSMSGKLGGIQRNIIHGNPGTATGRSLGGKHSIATHLENKDFFFAKKKITNPPLSKKLAEFVGILLGDGGINLRQVYITLNSNDETKYAEYVKKIIKNLFSVEVSVKKRSKSNALIILISRGALVEYLKTIGLDKGNKVKKQAKVPDWINKKPEYRKLCLRGLFDTDGCFFVDRHHIKDTIYCNGGVNFVNRSLPILSFFKTTLEDFGFHPKQTTKFSIFLRKEKEVIRFFNEIGSSNNKQRERFKKYYKSKYGRVPKWS